MFRKKGLLLIVLSLAMSVAAAWTAHYWAQTHSAAAVHPTTVETAVAQTARLTQPEPAIAETTIVVHGTRLQ
jgi:hypothetical protein